MPENLKAGIIALAIGSFALGLFFPFATSAAMPRSSYLRRSFAWIGITALFFFSHDFWLLMIGVAIIGFALLRTEGNSLANFFFLLFAMAPISQEIPGLGLFNQLFELNNFRILSLVLLVPCAVSIYRSKRDLPFGARSADLFLLGTAGMTLVLYMLASTFTNALRHGVFYSFLDLLVPYYVASRSIRHVDDLREAIASLLVSSGVMAAIGLFEFSRSWLLYEGSAPSLGIERPFSNYLMRGELIRIVASTGQTIIFGYVMMTALCLCGRFHSLKANTLARASLIVLTGVLLLGLLGSISKGPWLGAGVGIMTFVAVSRLKPQAGFFLSATIGILALVFAFSPYGYEQLSSLGVLSGVIDENILYRQRLVDIAISVLSEAPFFGVYDFLLRPEVQAMRQGQGIIDIVNSYVGIALTSGLVGITLFLGFFASVLRTALRSIDQYPWRTQKDMLMIVGIVASLLAELVTIFTCSSIGAIPFLYWTLGGLALASEVICRTSSAKR